MYAGVTHRGQHWARRRFTRIVDGLTDYRHFPGYWGHTTGWAWILDFRQASRLPTSIQHDGAVRTRLARPPYSGHVEVVEVSHSIGISELGSSLVHVKIGFEHE